MTVRLASVGASLKLRSASPSTSVCNWPVVSAAPEKVTVATPAETETPTDRPLVAVVTLLPLVSAMLDPSKVSTSLAPSVTLPTVRVSEEIVCPASTVDAATVLNRSAAAAPSA